MALITEKFFERDKAQEQERYQLLLDNGYSDSVARKEARECAEPPGQWVPLPTSCFLCGDKLTIPFIFWSGQGCDIGLHVKCAAKLSVALQRDVMEHLGGRDAAQRWYAQAKPKAIQGAGRGL